ncbi:hypothetical protein MUO14_19380 [Halobacillus shinanisalinarum]|uniref:Histidine kinase N-terminal 7TM region domain-containing protein n=1 Tax=Halobacillus shinanisalinarum TaxID=2932258 RepID=A0ABY4GX91_9BACI|nr:hypothetical protein [Halobacillus shinanisalinarum]UOQ92586.1 hypothetical protein MUO14_19380 [Halobacillus shinanisalinarum]
MGFAVFFFIAWLITALFFVIQKKLSITENTFVFMLILVISINWTWIIYEGFKFIKITEQPMDYTAFLFFRSVIIPVLLIMQLNMIHKSKTFASSALITMTSIVILLLITGLSNYFDLTKYVKWNIGYDALYFSALHFIAYYSHQIFRKITHREVSYS